MGQSQLRRLIAERARQSPDVAFLEDARSPRSVSFGQLDETTSAWTATLDEAELPDRATVLVDVADPLAFAAAFVAVIASGRCVVPVDANAPVGEKARMRRTVRAAMVISDTSGSGDVLVDELGHPRCAVFQPLVGEHEAGSLRLFTSGSTGEPKAVELTEAQLLHVAGQIAAHNQLGPRDRGYNSLPLFHINAEVVGVLASLVAGSTLILDRKFQRSGFWALMTERGITWINAVPALLAILAREPLPARPAGLRFIRSASAPLPASVRAAIRAAFGPVLVESYGMTEAASQITATVLAPDATPDGSVGRPIGVELQVRDEEGRRVDSGEIGRIWIRGEGVITGYVDGTAPERFDADGWLDTGDLGQLDAEGNLIHIGRADDVINRGGELVHPREIEEVLLADDRVTDAVVVGREDDVLGEVPVAYIVTTSADAGLSAELMARCEQHLSRFKRPVDLIVVDELPRASTGKVLRAEVRAAR